jgi:TrmH family RNA methyltransferase
VLVEGARAVAEALAGGAAVSFVVTSPKLLASDAGAALAARLEGLDVDRVGDDELADLADTENPQGILLVCKEPGAGLERVREGGRYLVLDGVQDPGNAGTLLRAAVAFGLDGVVPLDGTVDPWAAKTVRASAGMVFRLPVIAGSAQDVVARLGAAGVPILVADARGEDVERLSGAASFALVVGNEGAGVRSDLRRAARSVVAVPMAGPAESLNVGMAGSILLYTLTRGMTD